VIPLAVALLASYLIGAFPTSYLGGRLARGIDLLRVFQSQQSPRMAHFEVAAFDQHPRFGLEFEQTHQIADPGPRTADRSGDLLMGHRELTDQAIERYGFFGGAGKCTSWSIT